MEPNRGAEPTTNWPPDPPLPSHAERFLICLVWSGGGEKDTNLSAKGLRRGKFPQLLRKIDISSDFEAISGNFKRFQADFNLILTHSWAASQLCIEQR
jgi:hypothetical protein